MQGVALGAKTFKTAILAFSIAATQSRQEKGGLFFFKLHDICTRNTPTWFRISRERPDKYPTLPCFVSLSPLTTMF